MELPHSSGVLKSKVHHLLLISMLILKLNTLVTSLLQRKIIHVSKNVK